MTKLNAAIIGLGNPLMGDEGIGVLVAQALERGHDIPDGVDVIEMGTGGLAVVHEMAHRPKVVFVDCALMDEEPGTIRRFTPDEVVTRKVQPRLSLHEGDLMQSIKLSRQLDECPEEIVIFGIQPQRVEMGAGLTPTLEQRLNEYAGLVLEEVRTTA